MDSIVDMLQNIISIWGDDKYPSSQAIQTMPRLYELLREVEKKTDDAEREYLQVLDKFFMGSAFDIATKQLIIAAMAHPHHVLTDKFLKVYSDRFGKQQKCECQNISHLRVARVCEILENFYHYNYDEFEDDEFDYLCLNENNITNCVYHLAVVNFCKIAVGVPSFSLIKGNFDIYAIYALMSLMDASYELKKLNQHIGEIESSLN